MTALVIDSGVLAVALVDDGLSGRHIRRRLLGWELVAPELIDLEVTSVIRKRIRAGQLSADRAQQAIDDLANLPVLRLALRPLLARIWELHPNLTSYDAAYIASAELLPAPLLTADAKLAAAPGVRCDIEVVG